MIALLAVGGGLFGISVATQAQSQSDQEQNAALQAVAKMTEGQRTSYQTNGKFKADTDSPCRSSISPGNRLGQPN